MDKLTSAGGVLLNNKNQICLIHNTVHDEWMLPKGTNENDESVIETAKREVYEETGYLDFELVLNKEIGQDYFEFVHPKTNLLSSKTVHFFLFRLLTQKHENTKFMIEENLEGKWFMLDDAIQILKFENHRKIVESIKTYLE